MLASTKKIKDEEPAAIWVDVDDLLMWAKNPRLNDQNVDNVAESIKRFGFGSPVLARKENREIIAGHTRIKAAKKLGMARVPVRLMDLSEADAHLFALADNRLNELSPWDKGGLLEVLGDYGVDDVALAGWSKDDVATLGKGLDAEHEEKEIVEDEVPEPPQSPITRVGDVWSLGEHVLVCGDSTMARSVFAEGGARLMVTDPPYGVSYADKNEFLNKLDKGNRVQTPIENDHLSPSDVGQLWRAAFTIARTIVGPGAVYYVTGPQGRDLFALAAALEETGFPLRHMLVWVKNQFALGRSDYHYQHEPILYGWTEGAAHKAVENRSESSTWEIDKPRKSDLHPTMKPVELYARAMRNSSERGWVVHDPFAGSGTCFIAAQQMERTCWGMEIAPAYCDVIVERWQALTGGKATRRPA